MENILAKGLIAIIMLLAICILAFNMQNAYVMWSVILIPVVIGMLNGLEDTDHEQD